MSPVKKHKCSRHSTIDNYEELIRNCDELKMALMFKKNGGNPSHSLGSQKRSSPSVTPPNEGRMSHSHRHRHHKVDSTENSKEYQRKSAVSSVQIHLASATEKISNNDTRRSLRVREETLHLYEDNYHRNAQKEAAKRKWSFNSTSSSLKFRRRMVSKTTQGSDFNLHSMVSTPPRRKSHNSSATHLNDKIYSKFSDVDRSQVVSSLTRQKVITKTLVSRKVISSFNLDVVQVESCQNIVCSSNVKGTPQYKFKKETVGLQYLSKKYPMVDLFTLDKCYGLCNRNIRKTETMLLDVLAGKEVFPTSDFSCMFSKQR